VSSDTAPLGLFREGANTISCVNVYLAIQFPLTDFRPLLGLEKLQVPEWCEKPSEKQEFVHFFGKLQKRYKRTPGNLPGGEDLYYATAKRALTFPGLEKRRIWALRPPQGGLRALYHDTKRGVVERVEIGISAKLERKDGIDGTDCLLLLKDFLSLPTNIAVACPSFLGFDKDKEGRVRGVIPAPLVLAGTPLARLYLNGSTQIGIPVNARVVSAGEPAVFVLYKGDEIQQLSDKSVVIDAGRVNNTRVSYTTFNCHDRLVGVWFVDIDSASGTTLRKLRLGLGKIHAEHQAMLEVLRAYAAHKLDTSKELVDFLQARLGWLSSEHKYGVDIQYVRDIISAYGLARPTRDDLGELNKRIDEICSKDVAEQAQQFLSSRPTKRKGGVFVCYSHADDGNVIQRLDGYLKSLGPDYFSDKKIRAGVNWNEEIRKRLVECRVAVLLVSQSMVNSLYVQQVELPVLMGAAEREGVTILPVYVTVVGNHDLQRFALNRYQGISDLNSPSNPLERLRRSAEKNQVFKALRDRIDEIFDDVESPP
jgi:hypothetical protein